MQDTKYYIRLGKLIQTEKCTSYLQRQIGIYTPKDILWKEGG